MQVKKEDGSTTTDLKEISDLQQSFYLNLYTQKLLGQNREIKRANKYFLIDQDVTQLSDDDRFRLDEALTQQERANAVSFNITKVRLQEAS